MPKMERLSSEEVERLKRRRSRTPDLSEYSKFLDGLKPGDWGRVTLAEGESQRAIKRRLTTASRDKNMALKYRPNKGEQGQIVFEVK